MDNKHQRFFRISQKYLRRNPDSKMARSWAGADVHIETENGVWREGGHGYTYAGKSDAWILSFEEAQKKVAHCGPEKMAAFIRVLGKKVCKFDVQQAKPTGPLAIGQCENCLQPFAIGNVVLIYDDVWMHADCEHPYMLEVEPAEGTPPPCILLGEQGMIYPLPCVVQNAISGSRASIGTMAASLAEQDMAMFEQEIAVINQERENIAASQSIRLTTAQVQLLAMIAQEKSVEADDPRLEQFESTGSNIIGALEYCFDMEWITQTQYKADEFKIRVTPEGHRVLLEEINR